MLCKVTKGYNKNHEFSRCGNIELVGSFMCSVKIKQVLITKANKQKTINIFIIK